jgi:pimeloyl-ACP methyl ester carboxylesterase
VEVVVESVRTPDGRTLEVKVAGPRDGLALIGIGGTPDAGGLRRETLEEGDRRGLRQVSYARPGYAGSDRHEGRSVADCAADVEVVADALGIERFHTVGWSGGGPHTLACAALLPDRVIGAATIAGAAPHDQDLDWTDGMGDENIEEMGLAVRGADALAPFLEHEAEEIRESTSEDLLAILGDLVSPPDRAALTGEYAAESHSSLLEAVSTGIWGWLDDDLAFVRSWGFSLDEIRVPVSIWQGREDRFVPPAHGEWLAAHVPGARPHLVAGEGHISLSRNRYGEVLDELLDAGDSRYGLDRDAAA